MITEKGSKKGLDSSQVVMLNGALKLAEKWVNGMSGSLDNNNSSDILQNGRPARLGIGAAVPRENTSINFNDPIERKLRGKLDAEKRKMLRSVEESARDDASVDEDSDEDQESKTKAFVKKRPVNLNSSLQAKKKKK